MVDSDRQQRRAADLAVFVDRLAAAGSDRTTAAARVQIRRAIVDGNTPPGMRRLAEALAAGVDRAPAPRRSTEDAGSVAAAVRGNSLVVLDDIDEDGLAEAIDLLLADGMRVMITGSDRQLVDRVRKALPAGTAGRVLERLPALRSGELRELRGLLATSTPARRARAGQELPTEADLPDPAEVAELCRQTGQPVPARPGRRHGAHPAGRAGPQPAGRGHLGGPPGRPVAEGAARRHRVRVGVAAAVEPGVRPAPARVRGHVGGRHAGGGRGGARPGRRAGHLRGPARGRRAGRAAPLPRLPVRRWSLPDLLPPLGAARGAAGAGRDPGGRTDADDRWTRSTGSSTTWSWASGCAGSAPAATSSGCPPRATTASCAGCRTCCCG